MTGDWKFWNANASVDVGRTGEYEKGQRRKSGDKPSAIDRNRP